MREPPGPCGAGRLRCVCWAGLLDAPVGGGPPARRPRCELRSARRLEARPGPAAAHGHRSQALLPPTSTAAWPRRRRPAPRPGPPVPPAPSTPVEPGVLMIGSARLLEARPGPAAAHRHRGLALLWSLRHNANPSNDKRPGPQPHKQTLNNVRTRPVVQCLPMWRCAYSRLGLLVWAVHPIRRHCTRSERVQRHVRGAALRNGCSAICVVESLTVVGLVAQRCYAT